MVDFDAILDRATLNCGVEGDLQALAREWATTEALKMIGDGCLEVSILLDALWDAAELYVQTKNEETLYLVAEIDSMISQIEN